MTAPTVSDIEKRLRQVGDLADRCLAAYKWVHSAGHGRHNAVDGDQRVRSSDTPDEVHAIVISGRRARETAESAGVLIKQALSCLRGAEHILNRAMSQGDPPSAGTLTPRTATRAEVEGAERAKERREARGEGWGEA